MSDTPERIHDPVIDEAINWLVRLDMGDSQSAERAEFQHWLQKTPQHRLAWERVQGIRKRFVSLPTRPITHALEALDEQTRQSRISRRQALKVLSLVGLASGIGWAGREYTPWQRLLADYSTRTGEQARFQLADGSQVSLNTDTALATDLSGNLRRLHLRRGEMQLQIGPDQGSPITRPLQVNTAAGRITAEQGQVTVRLDAPRARVSVQSGQVELLSRNGSRQLLAAGDSRWLSDTGVTPAASAIAPDAWVSGVISGQKIPLGELLDELSRYRLGVIDYSPELEQLPVSGIFHLKDTDQTLHFLAQVQPIEVQFRSSLWVVVRPA